MFKTLLITIAAALATAALATAAPTPTLDGVSLVHATPSDVASKCFYAPFVPKINWQATGVATGAYAGTFSASGTVTATLAALPSFDGTFTITSPAGSLKGTLQRVDSRTTGSGGCNVAASDGWFSASGVVYTVTLPDGTIDQGGVELAFVDDLANSRLSATFRSTSRVADADLDGVSSTASTTAPRARTPISTTSTATVWATRATSSTTGRRCSTTSWIARSP